MAGELESESAGRGLSMRAAAPLNRPGQVLFASLIGTTIEFFDFYIYATAAVFTYGSIGVAAAQLHA